MQDMLKKIIEMDEQARLVKEQAQAEKIATEQEIEATKQKIHDEYITRAKDRVQKNLEVDKANAEAAWEAKKAQIDQASAQLSQMYDEKHDAWVEQIVSRVIDN